MYICTHIYIYVYIYIHLYIYIYAYMYSYVYIHLCMYVYIGRTSLTTLPRVASSVGGGDGPQSEIPDGDGHAEHASSVPTNPTVTHRLHSAKSTMGQGNRTCSSEWGESGREDAWAYMGYLAHKKQPPPPGPP